MPEKPGAERRRYERLKTQLLGRCMLADGRETKCTILDVSLSGVGIASPIRGAIGERVILYVDQIGRMEGQISRHISSGFALVLDVSTRATQRLANRLERVIKAGRLSPSPERRQEARARFHGDAASDGLTVDPYQVVDLSLTGADLKLSGDRPAVGAIIGLGKVTARVVRHTHQGVAVQFIDAPESLTRLLFDLR